VDVRVDARTGSPDAFTTDCRLCPRLAGFLDDVREQHPDYYALPVASFGDPAARLLIVGLAPGLHGANATGRPFTGDFAGKLLYETLHDFGLASRSVSTAADDGLRLTGCRITNAVRCVPPQNKPLPAEVRTCNGYLRDELEMLPRGAVVLALGTIAHDAVLQAYALRRSAFPFVHGRIHELRPGLRMIDSYHCSRYNTQTGRLTPDMFREVFKRIRAMLGIPAAA
jgi:uracil-DNA glycosylase family 4